MPYKLPVTSTPGLSNYVQEPQTKVFATQAEPIEPFANEPQDHPRIAQVDILAKVPSSQELPKNSA